MQHIANSTLLEGLILQFQNETSLFSTSSSGATLEDVASSSETTTEVVEQFLLQNTLSLVGANRRLSSSHQSLNHSEYSPVTLSPQWSRLGRLLLLSALCILGSVGNIFMISSVVIEDYLKRPGNSRHQKFLPSTTSSTAADPNRPSSRPLVAQLLFSFHTFCGCYFPWPDQPRDEKLTSHNLNFHLPGTGSLETFLVSFPFYLLSSVF